MNKLISRLLKNDSSLNSLDLEEIFKEITEKTQFSILANAIVKTHVIKKIYLTGSIIQNTNIEELNIVLNAIIKNPNIKKIELYSLWDIKSDRSKILFNFIAKNKHIMSFTFRTINYAWIHPEIVEKTVLEETFQAIISNDFISKLVITNEGLGILDNERFDFISKAINESKHIMILEYSVNILSNANNIKPLHEFNSVLNLLKGLSYNEHITSLNFSHNSFYRLNDLNSEEASSYMQQFFIALATLKNLSSLDLSDNYIGQLNETFFSLFNHYIVQLPITELNLKCSDFGKLSEKQFNLLLDTFSKLKLTSLNLHWNQLGKINTSYLKSWFGVHIFDKFTNFISNSTNLNILNLNDNNLNKLPKTQFLNLMRCLSNHQSIETLIIGGNYLYDTEPENIKIFSEVLNKNKKIKTLSLASFAFISDFDENESSLSFEKQEERLNFFKAKINFLADNILKALQENKTITSLNLGRNGYVGYDFLNKNSLNALSKLIENNTSIKSIDLSYTRVSEVVSLNSDTLSFEVKECIQDFFQKLSKNKTITRLDFKNSENVRFKNKDFLIKSYKKFSEIFSCNKNITKINISPEYINHYNENYCDYIQPIVHGNRHLALFTAYQVLMDKNWKKQKKDYLIKNDNTDKLPGDIAKKILTFLSKETKLHKQVILEYSNYYIRKNNKSTRENNNNNNKNISLYFDNEQQKRIKYKGISI